MNWEAIGAIGEILGALAVFATLIYLAVQLNQNARLMRGTIREYRTAANHNIQFQIATLMDNAELTAGLINNAMFRDWDTYLRQYNDGLIDQAEWQTQLLIWENLLTFEHIRIGWKQSGRAYSPELRDILDEIVNRIESAEDA